MGLIRNAGYAPDTGGMIPTWHAAAACREIANAEIFFPHHREQERHGAAAAQPYCNVCPVVLECLQAALEGNEFGTWGGMTQQERIKLKGRLKSTDYATVEALRETLEEKLPRCEDCGQHRKEKAENRCADCYRVFAKEQTALEAARRKSQCGEPGCSTPMHAKGKCRRHYLVALRQSKKPNSRNTRVTSKKKVAA